MLFIVIVFIILFIFILIFLKNIYNKSYKALFRGRAESNCFLTKLIPDGYTSLSTIIPQDNDHLITVYGLKGCDNKILLYKEKYAKDSDKEITDMVKKINHDLNHALNS